MQQAAGPLLVIDVATMSREQKEKSSCNKLSSKRSRTRAQLIKSDELTRQASQEYNMKQETGTLAMRAHKGESFMHIPNIISAADLCSTATTTTTTTTTRMSHCHILNSSSSATSKRRPAAARHEIKNRIMKSSYARPCQELAYTLGQLLSICCLLITISVPTLSNGSHHHHNQQAAALSAAATSSSSSSPSSSETIQSVLLDTTEHTSLDWTRYPDRDGQDGQQGRTPGWSEETFLQVERDINWRSFVTCDVAYQAVNNWLWTPYIERGDAQRLYIEIKFTMRDCNLFPQMVLSCKETFALLYKEVDGPVDGGQATGGKLSAANASFAQSDSYALIDTIAADEGRSTSNSDVVINTEIRSVPVSRRGVYFAFRDQGACLSLISIKVYSLKCPAHAANLARFNATHTGRDLTSLVAVDGECVPNSMQIEAPRMFCSADGQWNSMSSGQCKCLAGHEPAANQTKCQACPPGRFKSHVGDSPCLPCPERSFSAHQGAHECKCHEGYFRAPRDSRAAACTQPPMSPPQNLSATYVDSTSVVLQWQAPSALRAPVPSAQRDDLTYKLLCDSCDFTTLVSSPQFFATNFSETKCVLSGLQPSTSYRFTLYVMNGVSAQAAAATSTSSYSSQSYEQQFSEITVQTSKTTAQTTANTLSSANGGFQLLPVYNFRALPGARGSDMLLSWDAAPAASQARQVAPSSGDTFTPESSSEQQQQATPSLYEIKFEQLHPREQQASTPVDEMLARRSPYPILYEQQQQQQTPPQQQQPQSVTTSNRAIALYSLHPRTQYAFQLRAKWAHSSQWTDWSEPIYASTSAAPLAPRESQYPPPRLDAPLMPVPFPQDNGLSPDTVGPSPFPMPFDPHRNWPPAFGGQLAPTQPIQQKQLPPTASSWLGSFALILFCSLIVSILLALALVHYRDSLCLKSLSSSLSGGLIGSNVGSTYAGVYNGGTSSDLIAGVASGPLASGGSGQNGGHYGTSHHAGAGLIYHNASGHHPVLASHLGHLQNHHHHHNHLHTTLSAGSGSALIAGSNSTSRSSSGAGGVVQSFLAATLGQLSGNHHHHHNQHNHQNHNKTLHHHIQALEQQQQQQQQQNGKLFASSPNSHNMQQQQHPHHLQNQDLQVSGGQQRNHYHQMLGNVNHTLLFSGANQQQQQLHHQQLSGPFQQQPTVPLVPPASHQQLTGGGGGGANGQSPPQVAIDLFSNGGGVNVQQSKYGSSRTLSGQHQYGLANLHDPQMHIYDDLEVVSQSRQSSSCSPPTSGSGNGNGGGGLHKAMAAAVSTTPSQQQQQQQQQLSSLMVAHNAINGAHQLQNQANARELHLSQLQQQQQQKQQQQLAAATHLSRQAIYASTRELYEPSAASKFVITNSNNSNSNQASQQQQQQQQAKRAVAAAKFYKDRTQEDDFYDEQ